MALPHTHFYPLSLPYRRAHVSPCTPYPYQALLFPLDLIKVHFQVYDYAGKPYSSIMHGLRTIAHQEGVRGLYKGLSPALLANGVSWGGYFLFYEYAKNRYLRDREQLTSVHHLLSAFEAGVIMVFLTNPLWLIKTRMQLQPTAAAAAAGVPKQPQVTSYTGLVHAVRVIVKEEGAAGLYKGLFPALLLTSHGAIQFVTYEWLKKAAEPYQVPLLSYSLLGGVAKIVAGLATYPYQVIKARLQQRETGAARWRYTGTWDCVLKIWRFEGLVGYFKGCVPNVLKTAPSAAITFYVYEQVVSWTEAYRKGGGGTPKKSSRDTAKPPTTRRPQ